MKNLKLEVGKTYLNRKGERVKIVEETGNEVFPFGGDNCFCYTLDGRYWYNWKDSAFDLVAEAPQHRYRKAHFQNSGKHPRNFRK